MSASNPYVRQGTNVARNNLTVRLRAMLQFQTRRIFLNAVSATPNLWWNAVSKGLGKLITSDKGFPGTRGCATAG